MKNRIAWRTVLGCVGLALGVLNSDKLFAQAYPDNQTIFSDQDPTLETRRSDHFRVIFGHYNRDFSFGATLESLAQGNLQEFEWMWHRWVVEDGLLNINTSALRPNPMPGNYRANFLFLMTQNDGGGGGSYNSMDANGFCWAMDNATYCSFDPYSGAVPHEWGDCWCGTAGADVGSTVGGNLYECMGDWMMLQFLNWYPQAEVYIANGMYYPIHGRDYFDSWPIFETAIQTPLYGYPYMNTIFSISNTTPQQQVSEYFINRMIRLDPSGSADKRGAVNDLWGDMAKRLVTWDFQRQQWLAQANNQAGQGSSDPGTAWYFYQRCRTPLVPMAGTPGWYRPNREHLPMEFGFNIIPLQVTNGTTVSCNFQPQCDPVRQSDWRACFVAVDNNGGASYSAKWNTGVNSYTLSADQNQLYLVVIATPLPIGTEAMVWNAYLTFAGSQFPYAVSFSNAAPMNMVYPRPSGVTWKSHINAVDETVCKNIASSATVAATAYVGSNAMVLNSAQVLGSASIEDFGVVAGSAKVYGNAVVSGHGVVQDNAQVYGNAKVRDWGRVFGYAQVYGNGKVIEHGNCGDGAAGAGNYTTVSGNAIIKGTTYIYAPSTFNGCLIMDGDSSDGNGTTPASYGVHFGWQWGDNPLSFWNGLTNNNYVYAQYTFENTIESNSAVFAMDQYGINHGFLMNGCMAAIDTGADTRGGLVLPLNGTNQYVELPNSVSDFKDTTIAVWFKWAGGDSDQRVWSMGDGTNKVMYLTPSDTETEALRFVISDGDSTNYLDGGAVTANTWTHAAVVFAAASSNSTLYVNGVAVATNAGISLFPDSLNAPLMANANYLGRGNASNYFQGSVDDFRVYMESLAASNVLAIYNTPAPAPVTATADTNAPTPNPATWLVAPYAILDSAVTMSATQGADASGWVEYYFTCASGGGHDSGWVSFSKYTDCGLTPGTTYSYTVQMRDRNGNTTAASSPASATTLVSSAGTASFAYGPVGIANGQITMTAAIVTNASGKTEYNFARAGKSSGWQSSPSWTDTGLATGASYTYTVTVRDGRGNASAASTGVTATAVDDAAPLFPSFQQGQWYTMPYPTLANSISMTAATATDPSGVEYYFHCTAGGAPDSGWQTSPTYMTPVLADGSYSFEYKLRDQSPQTNQSGYSTIYTATITPTTGYHEYALSEVLTNADDCLVSFSATVLRVNTTNYAVEDLGSGAAITVEPNTSNLVTETSLLFKNVGVEGHLYTLSGSRIVTYAALTSTGAPALYTVSGEVTNSLGAGISGATVYFSDAPNASSNSIVMATSGANGNYSLEVPGGTWYLAANGSNYNTSADRLLVVSNGSVSNVNFGLVANTSVRGTVTLISNGAPAAGAAVYFSRTPWASVSPVFTATSDTNGNYAQPVQNGVWYVAAGGSAYYTTPDLTVTVTGPDVTNINFALKSSARNVPVTPALLFSVVTESLPGSGPAGNWPTYIEGIDPSAASPLPFAPMAAAGTANGFPTVPTVQQWQGVKMVENYEINSTAFQLQDPAVAGANYTSAIPINGATIVLAARPIRVPGDSQPWMSIVDIFYSQLCLGIKNDTGEVCVRVNDTANNTYTAPLSTAIPTNQTTIISLVVQPSGSFVVYTNGVQIYSAKATLSSGAFSALTPGVLSGPGGYADYINIGKNNPDGWPCYNGYIGDIFVYTNALAATNRQALEANLAYKFIPTNCQITASSGAGGTINPSGTVFVNRGGAQGFSVTPSAGFVVTNVVVDGVSLGAMGTYSFSSVSANHTISAAFATAPPPTLAISANGNGGIEISWSDTYSGQLLWSPTLGPGASWSPVGVSTTHTAGSYQVTVTPGVATAFYVLSQ
ncbi:MAG: DUF6055 domain-containing protein [Verrucomicrobiota bacterium]|jgi:hypothetical protein